MTAADPKLAKRAPAVRGRAPTKVTSDEALTRSPLALLKEANKKPTLLRVQIVEALLALEGEMVAATMEQLYTRLQESRANISIPSIFRVLAELTAAQVIDRHRTEGGPTIYAFRTQQLSTKLVCSSCHTVRSLTISKAHAQVLASARTWGFSVDKVVIRLRGRCHKCASTTPPSAAKAPFP